MKRYRAVVGVLLAAIATFLVSCSSGPAAVAPTYTPEKIAQVSNFVRRIESKRDRLPELLDYIEKDDWVNVDNFTHGPLGQFRADLLRLSAQLLPADQKRTKAMAEDIVGHLENIDEASKDRSYGEAITQYRQFVDDIDALLDVVPEEARAKAEEIEEEPSVYDMTTQMPEEPEVRAESEDMVRTPVMIDE